MGGLAVLLSIAAYVVVAVVIVRRIKSTRWKVFAVVTAVLLPTTDAVLGRAYLRHICATEGGLQVLRTVDGVAGFYDAMGKPHSSWITKHGYRFVEGRDFDGKPMRISLGPDNRLVEERNVILQSKYQFERDTAEFGVGFTSSEYRVRESKTGDVLVRYVNISYKGGWAERFLGSFSDEGGSFGGACFVGAGRIWPSQIVTRALGPIQANTSD